jgi:hypothetical protein
MFCVVQLRWVEPLFKFYCGQSDFYGKQLAIPIQSPSNVSALNLHLKQPSSVYSPPLDTDYRSYSAMHELFTPRNNPQLRCVALIILPS